MQGFKILFVCSALALGAFAADPIVNLPNLGSIQGRVHQTFGNGVPKKDYFQFRNIPFAGPVSGPKRFTQPVLADSQLGTPQAPYDATKSGPLCPQLGLQEHAIQDMVQQPIEDVIQGIIDGIDLPVPLPVGIVVTLLEDMFDIIVGGLTVGELVEEILDVSLAVEEDCLHLAVSTEYLPTQAELDAGTANLKPVMFFIYGGGFIAGTQMRMGYERLGDVNDVVLVGVNYRLGALGFMCLDTDDAGGNMGLLDQIVGLEWVQKNIAYFGGDKDRVTIFGQSAGAASVSMLTLSPLTTGLFHQAIGQSGAAVCPWAYDDRYHQFHAKGMASMLNCDSDNDQEIVDCLRLLPQEDIVNAQNMWDLQTQRNGDLGFGGINICGQTKGDRRVFNKGDDPQYILERGLYEPRPMFFGANKDEGLLGYNMAYNSVINDTMKGDEYFMKYEALDYLLSAVHAYEGYVTSDVIQDNYFYPEEMGDFLDMTPGMIDLMGAYSLKAGPYKIIQENSKRVDSFFYALEKTSRKSFNRIFSEIGAPDMPIHDPNGLAAHADDLLYLFEVPLPMILCDLKDVMPAMALAFDKCMEDHPFNIVEGERCLTDPQGEFRTEWQDCLDGHLLPEELLVSTAMVKAWTNFAIHGTPTPDSDNSLPKLNSWTRDEPNYIVFDDNVRIASDYLKSYSTKDRRPIGGFAP